MPGEDTVRRLFAIISERFQDFVQRVDEHAASTHEEVSMKDQMPKPVIRQPNDNTGVVLRGEPMAFLVTGKDTKHTSMFDWTIPAGFATGLHVHRVQEETFYVLDGECEWWAGDERIRATPGTFLFLPPGVPHNITNVSDKPARVIMTVSPPGHEHYFEELARLAATGTAPDPKAIGELRARYDTDQLSALTARS
jgi:quercetin dioxygenase-like cupin family protein